MNLMQEVESQKEQEKRDENAHFFADLHKQIREDSREVNNSPYSFTSNKQDDRRLRARERTMIYFYEYDVVWSSPRSAPIFTFDEVISISIEMDFTIIQDENNITTGIIVSSKEDNIGVSTHTGFRTDIVFETINTKGDFLISLQISEGEGESVTVIGLEKNVSASLGYSKKIPKGAVNFKWDGSAGFNSSNVGELLYKLKPFQFAKSIERLNELDPQGFFNLSADYDAEVKTTHRLAPYLDK